MDKEGFGHSGSGMQVLITRVSNTYFYNFYAGGVLLKRMKDETVQNYRTKFGVCPGDRTRHPLLVRRKR